MHRFDFEMTSADFHPDDSLLRISGLLRGHPHTADRIDSVELVNGSDSIFANDIDGVDFKRYFQWEEDGIISLEIDFPFTQTDEQGHSSENNRAIIFFTGRSGIKKFKVTDLPKITDKK